MTDFPKPPARKTVPSLWRRFLNWVRRLLVFFLILLFFAMMFTRWVAGKPNVVGSVEAIAEPKEPGERHELVVMSVNCAHGRAEAWHQFLKSKDELQSNCEAIGGLLKEHAADIVCLQECDAPSWWSGGFHHAQLIAETAEISQLVHARNVNGAGLYYGAALMSQFEVRDPLTHTFRPTPPTFTKGAAIGRMRWPGDESFEFDVVAVHLDFASGSARGRQVDELVEIIQRRGKPVIIAGDLNSGWHEAGAVRQLTSALELSVFEPETEMVTFPFTGERLDWVLVSQEFEIKSVEAIDAHVSDHRPLRAVVRRAGSGNGVQ